MLGWMCSLSKNCLGDDLEEKKRMKQIFPHPSNYSPVMCLSSVKRYLAHQFRGKFQRERPERISPAYVTALENLHH